VTTALEIAASAILRSASQASTGLIVRVIGSPNPALRAKAILYRFRKELNDPTLDGIQIRLSPDNPETELWLLNQTPMVGNNTCEVASVPTAIINAEDLLK
jgi:hypothetical protein